VLQPVIIRQMSTKPSRWRKNLAQQRINAPVYHLKPQRWNWSAVVRPLDRSLSRQAPDELNQPQVRNLRYFWIDGLFAAISENFYLGFIALYALALGASSSQIGWLTAVGNLMGAIALFPGARLIEHLGRRKPVVVWSGGGVARFALLGFAFFPFFLEPSQTAVVALVLLEGVRAFAANFANPAWTALVADLVPNSIRGRYFGSRNVAMGLAGLLVAPLAGRLIVLTNNGGDSTVLGYQLVFFIAFVFGMVSTAAFRRIQEPEMTVDNGRVHQRGDLRRAIRRAPGYLGLVASAFLWNLSLQVAGPFFTVYLVEEFQAGAGIIGVLAAISSLTALVGQRLFGRLMDKKGVFWVSLLAGFMIPILPTAWMLITAPWQVGLINTLGGFLWAGYNLANFNLLLLLTPNSQRARAVALYQTAVFSSAVIGPLLGGYLADAVSFHLIFAMSAVGRFLAMVLFVIFVFLPYRRHVKSDPPVGGNDNTGFE
jgi:MFS family permease